MASMSSGRDAQQPLPDATQSASGRPFVADLRAWLSFLTNCTDFQAWTFRADLARVDRSTRPGPMGGDHLPVR